MDLPLDALHKFPRTPHLFWLGQQPVRDDKVLPPAEAEAFLQDEIVVEEKVDGANLGISVARDGSIRLQNRGSFLEGQLSGQFARLRGWVAEHVVALREVLPPPLVLFGEWCYARHSIHYTHLPDWFLGFDVLDLSEGRFWSVPRRNELLERLGLCPVRQVTAGRLTHAQLLQLLNERSAYADAPLEGLYLRRQESRFLAARAKIVRPEFAQAMTTHWSKGPLIVNVREPLPAVDLVAGTAQANDTSI